MTAVLARQVFSVSRAADFLEARALVSQTGQPESRFGDVVLKELLDNALDASETAGVQPEITVTTDTDGDIQRVTVADNGAGIPPGVVGRILDFATLTSDKALYRSPCRGAQGNALKTIIGMIPAALGVTDPVIIEARGVRNVVAVSLDAAGPAGRPPAGRKGFKASAQVRVQRAVGTSARRHRPSGSRRPGRAAGPVHQPPPLNPDRDLTVMCVSRNHHEEEPGEFSAQVTPQDRESHAVRTAHGTIASREGGGESRAGRPGDGGHSRRADICPARSCRGTGQAHDRDHERDGPHRTGRPGQPHLRGAPGGHPVGDLRPGVWEGGCLASALPGEPVSDFQSQPDLPGAAAGCTGASGRRARPGNIQLGNNRHYAGQRAARDRGHRPRRPRRPAQIPSLRHHTGVRRQPPRRQPRIRCGRAISIRAVDVAWSGVLGVAGGRIRADPV